MSYMLVIHWISCYINTLTPRQNSLLVTLAFFNVKSFILSLYFCVLIQAFLKRVLVNALKQLIVNRWGISILFENISENEYTLS